MTITLILANSSNVRTLNQTTILQGSLLNVYDIVYGYLSATVFVCLCTIVQYFVDIQQRQ
jgi:hypothetical protein